MKRHPVRLTRVLQQALHTAVYHRLLCMGCKQGPGDTLTLRYIEVIK